MHLTLIRSKALACHIQSIIEKYYRFDLRKYIQNVADYMLDVFHINLTVY